MPFKLSEKTLEILEEASRTADPEVRGKMAIVLLHQALEMQQAAVSLTVDAIHLMAGRTPPSTLPTDA